MKKGLKSLLFTLLSPIALVGAQPEVSKLGFNWEISYQEDGIETFNQVDFKMQDLSVTGSVTSQPDSNATYGLNAKAKSVGKTFGNYSGRKSNSYFNGTRKTRNDLFYAGVGFQRHTEDLETELFAGAKVGNVLLSSSKSADNKRENSAYVEFPTGRVIGLTKTTDEGVGSSGAYYSNGDLGAQVNFAGENFGSKISFKNLLSKIDEVILDKSERFGAEVGYGKETGGIFGLGYHVYPSKGPIQSFNISVSGTEESKKGTVIENNATIRGKNLRFRYETGTSRTDFGLDVKF